MTLKIDWKEAEPHSENECGDAAFVEIEREVAGAFAAARESQANWVRTEVRERLAAVKRLRQTLAAEAETVARELCGARPGAEFLGAQLIPFLDACRFLERNAARLLKGRRLGRAPLWLWAASMKCGANRTEWC